MSWHFSEMKKSISLLLALGLLSCTSAPKSSVDSAPSTGPIETIAILGVNDIHGNLTPEDAKTRENPPAEPISYQRGGAAYLASHVRILRKEWNNRLMILDAGDEFQGSLESNIEEGAPMVRVFNSIGLTAAAIGNHEFDFGPVGPEGTAGDPQGALKERLKEAKYPYLSANMVKTGTDHQPDFQNLYPSKIFDVGRLKVGLIGLSTTSTPTTTRSAYVKDLTFKELKEVTLRESERLRKEGAQIIIVVAHAGLKCAPGKASLELTLRKPSDLLGECDDNEIPELLNSIPRGTVDAVVSGHTHTVVHHWVAGVPVIQAGTRNAYFNMMYLSYDLEQKKILADQTRIEGPVPICPLVFENQKDCNGARPVPPKGRGKLVTPTFHNQKITADSEVSTLIEPTVKRVAELKKKIVGEAARPIEHPRGAESELGNLVADAMRAVTQADVALVNSGGLRAPFEAGKITYGDLFRTLPFDNGVSIIRIKGSELKTMLRIAESGSRSFFPVSGMHLRIIDPKFEAPSSDLDGDKKIADWEVNRLIEAKFDNGNSIEDQKEYRLATIDFLVTGGDDMGWIMSRIPKDRIDLAGVGMIRDVVEKYMTQNSPLNTAQKPLVDSGNPRLKFEKPAAPASKKKRSRSKKKGRA